jgi:hypothetical protein
MSVDSKTSVNQSKPSIIEFILAKDGSISLIKWCRMVEIGFGIAV